MKQLLLMLYEEIKYSLIRDLQSKAKRSWKSKYNLIKRPLALLLLQT